MANHSSATVRETPHVNQTSTNTIVNALRQRAQSVINDRSIDPQSRAIIRYALETNDPWLAKLVRRADAGETLIDSSGFLKTSSTDEEKIAALAEMISMAWSRHRLQYLRASCWQMSRGLHVPTFGE